MNDEDGLIEGTIATEEWSGTIQCQACDYWGDMNGWTYPEDEAVIMYLCPECQSWERVRNPFA